MYKYNDDHLTGKTISRGVQLKRGESVVPGARDPATVPEE